MTTKIEFNIDNKKIIVKTPFDNDIQNDIDCVFNFISEEWHCLEKYVIFWNEKNKSTILSLGKKDQGFCHLPKIIAGNYFYIQVYVSDKIITNKLKINISVEEHEKEHCEIPIVKEQQNCWTEREALLAEKNRIINRIEYENNNILIYSENKLIKTINLLDQKFLNKIQNGLSLENIVDTVLSDESNNAIANKTVYNALLDFLKKSDLSKIALTGDYNDLKNIPSEFNPTHHNHVVVDVVDYEENINFDLGRLLDGLYDEITKE